MAIKINTAYGERLTSGMLNEKISNIVGGNEKLSGFDVSLASPTSVKITPGKAIVNGCAIEETSDTQTITVEQDILSVDGIAYVVLEYTHESKRVIFTCKTQVSSNMVKLATLFIKDGVISEITNHNSVKTLNTVVSEAAEIEAQKIRDSIPSGFIELGELDYDYMLNNENQVKLKSKSVAYVNGYRVEIPKDTIINIGKAPEKDPREDLIFLEAWKDTDFLKDGQLKWRIRHVANADFSSGKLEDGLAYVNGTANEELFRRLTYPQGGNVEPLVYDSPNFPNDNIRFTMMFRKATITRYDWQISAGSADIGLFIGGDGQTNSKKVLKTLDGYVYAIPMFRLYRKPSCGKSIPFEYQKINPEVDYSKFTRLMKEEKVERVVSETISGRSLINLLQPDINAMTFSSTFSGTGATYVHRININRSLIKPDTEYTFICDINIDSFKPATTDGRIYTELKYVKSDNTHIYTKLSSLGIGPNIVILKFNIPSTAFPLTDIMLGIGMTAGTASGRYIRTLLLEGDWTNKPFPEHFTGLKSLGEDEGNLITVRNAILNESSYDPDTGTPKLNTVEGVNHISSDNLIMPTIEAQVKRGETKLSDLTSFDKIDNMAGDEVVDFTKIKGRTLQNLVPDITKLSNSGSGVADVTKYTDGFKFTVTESGSFVISSKEGDLFNLKSNTKYTAIVNIKSNALDSPLTLYKSPSSISLFEVKKLGMSKVVFDTGDLTAYNRISIGSVGNYLVGTSIEVSNFMILEGDYTTIPLDQLPFIEGIQSVGENEVTEDGKYKVKVKSCGKNLLDNTIPFMESSGILIEDDKYVIPKNTPTRWCLLGKTLNLKPNTTYSLSVKDFSESGARLALSYREGAYIKSTDPDNINVNIRSGFTFTTDHSGRDVYLALCTDGEYADSRPRVEFNIQLEEGTVATDFEPYKEYKQEITLKEPLRSLPNGVCDTIEGNKVIRRIDYAIYNGGINESWETREHTNSDYCTFTITTSTTPENKPFRYDYNYKANRNILLCNNFASRSNVTGVVTITSESKEQVSCLVNENNTKAIYITIRKSKLSSPDLQGFKTWLSQNPTTVYYELATPIEEPIEPNYDKESIKTYQLDQPLRALPNGVKDEIVDGKLIRRCGEIIINDNSSIGFRNDGDETTTISFNCNDTREKAKVNTNYVINDRLPFEQNSTNGLEGVAVGGGAETYIEILRSRLSSPDIAGFKSWLQTNPIKVIYELASPIEVPLKEVHSNTSDFSLERQFKYSGNYLLELPNGVKDTVEDGKVIRRVRKVILNGSESGAGLGSIVNNSLSYVIENIGLKNNGDDVLNVYATVPTFIRNELESNTFGICSPQKTGSFSNGLTLILEPSRLETSDLNGIKNWLAKNPITVMFELATPTEEALSSDNNMYCPSHEINTYCGSMYVGDGTNDVLVKNGLKNDSIVIDTPFRSIADKEVVDDCKYKKSVDGYIPNIVPMNRNIIDFKQALQNSAYVSILNNGVRVYCFVPGQYRYAIIPLGKLKPNTKYAICFNSNTKSGSALVSIKYGVVNHIGESSSSFIVTTLSDPTIEYRVQVYCSTSISSTGEVEYTDIEIIESDSIPQDYVPYKPMEKAFENTEENDIEDLRHLTSLVGFNYEQILNENFDKLLRGEL